MKTHDDINFYELFGIPEDATDEQIDVAFEEYVFKNQLNNPEDQNSVFKKHTLERAKEALKTPNVRHAHSTMNKSANYSDNPSELKALLGLKDLMIEKLKKVIEGLEGNDLLRKRHIETLEGHIEDLEKHNKSLAEQIVSIFSKIEKLEAEIAVSE